MIIGIIGAKGNGKQFATQYITNKGFHLISPLKNLEEELASREETQTTSKLQDLRDNLEKRFGTLYLLNRSLCSIDEKENYLVMDCATEEELSLLKNKGVYLIYIEEQPKQKLDGLRKYAEQSIPYQKSTMLLSKELDKALYICKTKRPSWDDYFLGIMMAVRERGTCDRGKAGSLIVKNNRILATGYVGSVMGMKHCDEVGHLMHEVVNEDGTTSKHCIRTVHAEQNALIQAARNGVAIDGATIYCSMTPCLVCAKLIINAGIKRVVANKDYHKSKLSKVFFKAANVKLEIKHEEVETYSQMQGEKS